MNTRLFDIASTFGVPAPPGMIIAGYAERTPFVPSIDPNYIFRKSSLQDVLCWLEASHEMPCTCPAPPVAANRV